MHILNGILHSSNRMLNTHILKGDFNPLKGTQKPLTQLVLELCIPLMYVDKNEVIEYSYIPTLLHIATLHKYKLKRIPDHTWPIDKAKNN